MKLFLNNLDPEIFNQAIKKSKNIVFFYKLTTTTKLFKIFMSEFLIKVLDEIGVDSIDTLIISFPDKIFNQENLPIELIMPIWTIVQNYIDTKQIVTAGLSDFNAKYLVQFSNAIPDRNVTQFKIIKKFLAFS